MKYNHTGLIDFTIISEKEDPAYLSADELRSALLQRIIDIDTTNFSHSNKNQDWYFALGFGDSYQIEISIINELGGSHGFFGNHS